MVEVEVVVGKWGMDLRREWEEERVRDCKCMMVVKRVIWGIGCLRNGTFGFWKSVCL